MAATWHTVLQSDTLRGLAVRYYGDHKRWVEIAKANGIVNEYDDLSAYNTLLIPDLTDDALGDPGDPFYVDVAVGADGGLALDARGEVRPVGGPENLMAGLLRALTTDLGDLLPHPGYGIALSRYIGFAGTPLFHRFLALEVRRVILRDPRVADVKNIRVRQKPGTRHIEIAAEVLPIGGGAFIRLLFDREAA